MELMQQLCFGRIENLTIHAGEPTFDPPPKVSREFKFGPENARQLGPSDDFVLKSHFNELFDHLEQIGDGSIAVLEIRHGLPFRLVVEQPV